MTVVRELADFVARASWEDLTEETRAALKMRVLDSLGCAIGAVGAGPPRIVRAGVEAFGGRPRCTLIGGGRTAPDRAAFYNGTLVRYLDFNDAYLAPGETCHPSDNLGAVLAAAEDANRTGREMLVALAVAYQVQCRLSDAAPVRDRGFDHVTHGAYSVAAGVAKALDLDSGRTANAIGIAGAAGNALRVTRTGQLSHWKGLAFPNAALAATHGAYLAGAGITGPSEIFEGNKGFMDAIAGPFEIDWIKQDLDAATGTVIKRFNAEIHSQSAIEAMLELRARHHLRPDEVARIELETFDVAYNIIGGGEEGSKKMVVTKEQADHSLPYLLAVALLDGEVMPAQFQAERITAPDVQTMLKVVDVHPADDLSARFPLEHPCRLRVKLLDGETLFNEKTDYEGFVSRPMTWDSVQAKFDRLAVGRTGAKVRNEIAESIDRLDEVNVTDLMRLLAQVEGGPR